MGAGSWLSGNSDSGPHAGALKLVAPGSLSLYRGSLRLISERAAAVGCRGFRWHSWPQQIASIERLCADRFEWVLPGHGQRMHLPADAMQVELSRLVESQKLVKSGLLSVSLSFDHADRVCGVVLSFQHPGIYWVLRLRLNRARERPRSRICFAVVESETRQRLLLPIDSQHCVEILRGESRRAGEVQGPLRGSKYLRQAWSE